MKDALLGLESDMPEDFVKMVKEALAGSVSEPTKVGSSEVGHNSEGKDLGGDELPEARIEGGRFSAATMLDLDCLDCGAAARERCKRVNRRGRPKPCGRDKLIDTSKALQ